MGWRQQLNENPVVQAVLIGVLLVVGGFLFMTRIAGGGGEETATSEPPLTTPGAATTGTAPADATAADPTAIDPSGAVPADAGAGAVAPVGGEGFVAGPGLPEGVVAAYDAGKTVVILVVRQKGFDDRAVAKAISAVGSDAVVFVTAAKGIAKYSRVTQGVDVDRVPAIVVVHPKRLTEGPLPEATVSYGYRGPESIAQAVRDANYKGTHELPYYPAD